VFPQFGLGGALPKLQHGFARISTWEWSGTAKDSDNEVSGQFTLSSSAKTLELWPYPFKLTYTVCLKPGSLTTTLKVDNPSFPEAQSFDFTALLHTYFRTAKLDDVKVLGLKGLTYKDKVQDSKSFEEQLEAVTVSSEVDRVYMNSLDCPLQLEGSALGKGRGQLHIHAKTFRDTVVWNPWAEKAKAMSDFHDLEVEFFRSFRWAKTPLD
jgi:glucose-6-phosphate 1-epimerase